MALVQQYTNSLKGLNLQQAQLALSTKLLSDEQKEQILVQAGLKASEDAIQAELLQTTLEQKGLSVEKQRAILIELGLMDETTFELFAEKTCTKEKLKGKLAQELKNKTDERGILTTLGLGEANLFTAETFKLMGKQALMALKTIATNPITWVIAGIVATIGVVDLLTTSMGEARESFEALEEVTSELESTQSELASINDKIAEIKAKGKLELTDKIELQKLETERAILEDQVRLLELKKELAADKSNKDAVDATKNPIRGFGKKTKDGWTTSDGAVDTILDGTSRKSGQGSLVDAYEDLAEIEEQIKNTDQSDTKKLTKLYEKKANIQADINEDKNTLTDVYSENLELLEQITGNDPASQAAREKLLADNEKIERYLFSAEELVQKNIERFKSKFATHYNEQLDLIQNAENHGFSNDFYDVSGNNIGIAKTGVTKDELDGLVTTTKELNQSFVDGKITTTEYFDNLSKEIEKIGLEDVGKKLNGGDGDDNGTDYLEQTIATLSSQVSDAMLYADASFKAGEISVGDYIDTLDSGIDAQKKLLKSTYNLEEGEDGLIKNTENLEGATKDAADAFNNLVESQKGLDELDEFADSFGGLVDEMLEAGYIEGENISEKILGDPALFTQTVDTLSDEMRRLYAEGGETADNLATTLADSFGVSEEEMRTALGGAKGNLEALVGENMNAVNAMENAAAQNAQNTITNSSQAIGRVLGALGDAISNFDYTLKATGFLEGNKEILRRDEDGKITGVNMPASFGWTISGSGGSSVESISQALTDASNYFNASNEPIDVTDWGSTGGNAGGKPTGGTTSGKSGGSSSSDADKAEKEALEKFKEGLETREKLLERYKKAVDLTDFGLDIAEENDFALRADLLNNKMSQLTSYGLAMREEFDRVASIIPKTGEEAEALGSHLESLGSDMRDNIKNLRETRVAMEQLKIDSIVSIGDYYLGDLENELSSIEKRIEILNKDNKEDYKYTNQILQMEMFLPTASSTIGAQNKRRNADQDIIASEQATQDTLNDMFETQIKLNDKLREDERQALLEDMETMRQDMVLKLESANKDYDSSWQTAQATTDTGISNIENALNNMNMTIPAPDISAVVTACEQVKEMLDHMGDADYTPPKLRISDGINGGDANSIISGNKPNIVSNVAKNQLGVPYTWGGIAPGEGLDCSGLTQYAYGVAGVSLPRRSQEQWSCGTGTRIDWKNLKKGDQLFFGSNGEATHTGIYVGNGQMIHAPHTGDVVKYSSIETEYYQGMFLGAKRYAVGTPNGNAQARRFGIAGENFKPEILIDKITGETKYIDKPTLIDITKTDVVGEKATAKMPKFATGTPMANEKYLKEIKEACEAFDVPYNIALSLIDQESANGTESDTWRKNSAGAVGLTQITASALGDFRETQHQVTRDILAKLSENNVNFENSRTESESAYRDNIWTGIANLRLLNDRYFNGDDSTWKKTLGWYYAGGAYNGSKGQWYANQVTNRANSQPFVDVAKALGDNTIALEANTEAIEETDANKLKIKEIQDDVNSTAKEIDKSVSSTRVQQIQILNDAGLSDREKTFELFNIYEPAADDAAEIGYKAWNSLYNKFMDWWQKTETGEEDFVQETFDSYIDGLDKIKETVTDVEENVVGLKETIVGYMEDDLAEIDEYIEKHNFYNDWDIIGDTEADAIERQMDTIRKYYDEGIISAEEYFKRIEDLTQEHIEAEKRFYDSFFNDIESEISKTYDIRISRLNSHSSLLSTHFNLVNAISEEQHNLNKELIEAETIGARMNEQERETLFTKQEHAKLSSKLNDILSDAKNIQASYTAELANATSDTIEEITNNCERQYELKMKEYEVVKAELSLAKAQQQLENVKNEKSVRTWTGSSWGYDSNLQDVLEAESAAEDARYEVLKAKTAENQEIALNAIDAEADALQTEKNKFSSALEEMSDSMNTSGRDIDSWLKTIAETDLPMFDKIVRAVGDTIKQGFDISDEDISDIRDDAQRYNDTIAEMQANSEEWYTATPERRQELRDENKQKAASIGLDWDKKSSRWKKANGNYAYEISDSIIIEKMKANSKEWHTATPERQGDLKDENTRLAGLLGLDWDDSTGRWKKSDGTYAYANGTKNAHKGLGLYDEEGLGSELILRDGVLTQFQGGERVFSPEMADRLWEMAQQNYNFAPTIVQPDFGRLIPIEDKISNAFSNISNAFGDTYMIKDVQLNESEGGTLKGFMNFLKKYT